MARVEEEPGFVEKGMAYFAVLGLLVALAGAATDEPDLVGLGIAALVGGLLGKSLFSSKPQSA